MKIDKKLFNADLLAPKIPIALHIYKRKILEYCRFDSLFLTSILSSYYIVKIFLCRTNEDQKKVFIAGRMFKRAKIRFFREYATKILKKSIEKNGIDFVGNNFRESIKYNEVVESNFDKTIQLKLQSDFLQRMLILSPPTEKEKGVILVAFNRDIGYFSRVFNLDKLSESFVLAIEPSTTGFYDKEILALLSNKLHVVVQTFEYEIDGGFLKELNQNLHPFNCAANQWIDQRLFYPIENSQKKYDIIMVAIWNDIKRHYELFSAMKKSKKEIRVALVGMPWEGTIKNIKDQVEYYGVLNQIDFYENLSSIQINELLNQSKFCILLSKKEGSNRAVVESLFANTPILVRNGLNYGKKYPLINFKTGLMFNSNDLVRIINSIDEIIAKNSFEPYAWANNNISMSMSNNKLIEALKEIEYKFNIRVNKEIAQKVNNPEMDYFDKKYWELYKSVYKSLGEYLR